MTIEADGLPVAHLKREFSARESTVADLYRVIAGLDFRLEGVVQFI
ncbi:MAG: hypothetical protein ABSB52_11940 [Acidimicrobiales bacterium]